MVADGKISAEEAATLMRSLEESAEEEIRSHRSGIRLRVGEAGWLQSSKKSVGGRIVFRLHSALGRNHPHSIERVVDVFHPAKCGLEFLVLLHGHAAVFGNFVDRAWGGEPDFALVVCEC